ncbi:MAG: hypothetical protein ACE5E9_04325 [Nitrospinaceae bacterium]
MTRILINSLKPGMVLAEDLKNPFGKKLLPRGTVLEEKHIMSFKAWGVTEADIELGDEKPTTVIESDSIDPEQLKKAEQEARDLFRHSNLDHPAVTELLRLCSLNKLQRKPGKGNTHAH